MTDPSERWRVQQMSRQGSVKDKWPFNKEDRAEQRPPTTRSGSTDGASGRSRSTGQSHTQVSGASTYPKAHSNTGSKIPSSSASKHSSQGISGGSSEAAQRKGHTGPVGGPPPAGLQHSADTSKTTPTDSRGSELRRSSSPYVSTNKTSGQRSQIEVHSSAHPKSRTTSSSSGTTYVTLSSQGSRHSSSSSSSSSSSDTVSSLHRDRHSGHMPSDPSSTKQSQTTHKKPVSGGSESRPHKPRPRESSYDESGGGELSLGDGARGRMRDVEDDMVHISMFSSEGDGYSTPVASDVEASSLLQSRRSREEQERADRERATQRNTSQTGGTSRLKGQSSLEAQLKTVSSSATPQNSHHGGDSQYHLSLQQMENTYQSKITAKDTKIRHLENQLSQQQSYNDQVTRREMELAEECSQSQCRVQALEEENERLRRENEDMKRAQQHYESLESGNLPSGETYPSGERFVAQANESDSMAPDKMAVDEEGSFDMQRYRKTLSKSSSSGSTFEKPATDLIRPSERVRSHSQLLRENTQLQDEVKELKRQVSALREAGTSEQKTAEKYFEQATASAQMVSGAEEREKKLLREKEKLERKLKEAENVAAQVDTAVAQLSEFEAERKEYQKTISTLEHQVQQLASGAVSQDQMEISSRSHLQALQGQVHSLQSQLEKASQGSEEGREELLSLRIAKAELESQLQSLRENLVEIEAESKRQNRTHSQTIAGLEVKLSREKSENQRLRQSLTSSTKTSAPRSPDESSVSEEVARLRGELRQREEEIHALKREKERLAMSGAREGTSSSETAHLLEQKEEIIKDLNAKLQQFHKTARDFSKIAQHSKGQSEMISRLRGDLEQAQSEKDELAAAKESIIAEISMLQKSRGGLETALKASQAQAERVQAAHGQLLKQLEVERGTHKAETAELSKELVAMRNSRERSKEAERSLEQTIKEKNHWQQKSVQQDAIIQNLQQDTGRLHRQVTDLNSTITTQGAEVQRLQRENQALQGELETYKFQAMTYKEDFETERKDRESAHSKMVETETRYTHQLETMAAQLQAAATELQRHKEALSNTEELLQRQQKSMMSQLQQKEEELQTSYRENRQLHEDVMSKTQQVKQYKKHIDQLNDEIAGYKQQAQGHKEQIEFLAQRTDTMQGKEKTLRDMYERKFADLEGMCDRLRAENTELRNKLEQYMLPASSGGKVKPTPVMKAQTLGSFPARRQPDNIQVLPSQHRLPAGGLPKGRSFDEDQLQHQSSGSGTNHRQPPSTHGTTAATNHQYYSKTAAPEMPPPSVPGMMDRGASTAGRPGHIPRPAALSSTIPRDGRRGSDNGASYLGQKNWDPTSSLPLGSARRPLYNNLPLVESPYSSLPSSGQGIFGPQNDPYVQDGRSHVDTVEKDSPPNSNIGQLQPPLPHLQRKAHSHLQSMVNTGGEQRPRGGGQGSGTGSNHRPYVNYQPPYQPSSHSPSHIPQPRGGQPNSQMVPPKQPYSIERAPTSQPKGPYSTPVEESMRYPQTHVGGYGRPPPQPSHHGHYLTAEPPQGAGRPKGRDTSVPARASASERASVSPSASQSDISKDIDADIHSAASKMKESDQVEGQNEDIPFDPYLVCQKCGKRFRVGEIQSFRKHVSSAH